MRVRAVASEVGSGKGDGWCGKGVDDMARYGRTVRVGLFKGGGLRLVY